MKAIRIHELGGPEVLRYEEAPDPVPKPGDAVVFHVMRSDAISAARRGGAQTGRTPKWTGAFLAGTMPKTQ